MFPLGARSWYSLAFLLHCEMLLVLSDETTIRTALPFDLSSFTRPVFGE